MAQEERVVLVLTNRYEHFRTYIERQYGRHLGNERSVVIDGVRYNHGYHAQDVMGLDRQTTVVRVIYGGRITQAYEAARERFANIEYRETLP